MQTILGANGVIGRELAKALPEFTDKIRLVSRTPRQVNENDELFPANLLDAAQTEKAVAGSEVAYLTVGLPYKTTVWRQNWPVIMNNVVEACQKHNTKLVFFDNVYMYGKVDGWMSEDTPHNPISKKGRVRAQIVEYLMAQVDKGKIKALIARAADFYGPGTPNSLVSATVFDNYAKGKKAMWMLNDQVKHSFTYTPDAGKATAILGNSDHAYNQVWHLPTHENAMNGEEFIRETANVFGIAPNYQVIKMWMLKMLGVFNPIIRESIELLYQNKYPYLFSSKKFESTFNYQPITYKEGISETVRSYRK